MKGNKILEIHPFFQLNHDCGMKKMYNQFQITLTCPVDICWCFKQKSTQIEVKSSFSHEIHLQVLIPVDGSELQDVTTQDDAKTLNFMGFQLPVPQQMIPGSLKKINSISSLPTKKHQRFGTIQPTVWQFHTWNSLGLNPRAKSNGEPWQRYGHEAHLRGWSCQLISVLATLG